MKGEDLYYFSAYSFYDFLSRSNNKKLSILVGSNPKKW